MPTRRYVPWLVRFWNASLLNNVVITRRFLLTSAYCSRHIEPYTPSRLCNDQGHERLLLTENITIVLLSPGYQRSFRHSRPPSSPSARLRTVRLWWLDTRLATVVYCWSWTFCRSGWSAITNCRDLCWCAAGIGPLVCSCSLFSQRRRRSWLTVTVFHITSLLTPIRFTPELSRSVRISTWSLLEQMTDVVTGWHIRHDLLLKTTQTETLISDTGQQVAKVDQSGGFSVFGVNVPFIPNLRILGVPLDWYLLFDNPITSVVRITTT